MVDTNWWTLGLRGVATILFGLVTLTLPGLALATLVALFGAYALVEGGLTIVEARRAHGGHQPAWPPLLGGLVSVAIGLVALVLPGLTELALLYVVATWAIVSGVFALAAAARLERDLLSGLNGVLSVVFGLLMMLWPAGGALSVAWLLGGYAIVLGAVLLRAAVRLRRRTASPTALGLTDTGR